MVGRETTVRPMFLGEVRPLLSPGSPDPSHGHGPLPNEKEYVVSVLGSK